MATRPILCIDHADVYLTFIYHRCLHKFSAFYLLENLFFYEGNNVSMSAYSIVSLHLRILFLVHRLLVKWSLNMHTCYEKLAFIDVNKSWEYIHALCHICWWKPPRPWLRGCPRPCQIRTNWVTSMPIPLQVSGGIKFIIFVNLGFDSFLVLKLRDLIHTSHFIDGQNMYTFKLINYYYNLYVKCDIVSKLHLYIHMEIWCF
jgi:hypothetical protein